MSYDNDPITINLFYNFKNQYYYFEITYKISWWGKPFSQSIASNSVNTYKIRTPQEFDKMIEYFNETHNSINLLVHFRKLLECDYYKEYVSNTNKDI